MPDDGRPTFVLDASVAAKIWFEESDSNLARQARRTARILAPDFLVVELASIAAKVVRRGLASEQLAGRAIRGAPMLADEWARSDTLALRAYELARSHGVSAYDGLYLALAEKRHAPMITADGRLVAMARASGLGELVRPLAEFA